MNIELTVGQIERIIENRMAKLSSDQEQERYAKMIFRRVDSIDPFTALRAVIREVATQHGMKKKQVLELLK